MSLFEYISIAKLVEKIKEFIKNSTEKRNATHILVYFEGKNSKIDRFNNICVSPIYIEIKCGDIILKTLNHKEIIEMFNKIVKLTFSQNYHRQIPDKIHLYNLIIQLTPMTFFTPNKQISSSFNSLHSTKSQLKASSHHSQIKYYNAELYKTLMESDIKKVRNTEAELNKMIK